MKKIIYIIFVLTGMVAVSITMVACGSPVKAENIDLAEEVTRVNQENQELREEIYQLQQNNQELDEEIAKLDPTRAEKDAVPDPEIKEESVFNIYGANIETYQVEILKEITIKDNYSLEQRLEVIAQELSEIQFGGIGIEVTKIEDRDGKKIATINLTEVSNPEDKSWETDYFQGSTGGIITSTSLQESFLQKDYQGEWIDGVTFLYEGQQIQLGHVESLGEISYR